MWNILSTGLRHSLAAAVGATVMLAGTPALADPADTAQPLSAEAAAASDSAACDPQGTTAADAALATKLNSQLQVDMRGAMNAYRTSCARMVVEAVKARGLSERAAVIAITTVIVETHLVNLNVKLDHTSLGLFQQQDPWGSEAQRLDPVWATNAFLDKMLREYPDDSWKTAQIGAVCQEVQQSQYGSKYQPQAGDAQIIVDALWNGSAAPGNHDFDGDGDADLFTRNASTKALWLYKGAGNGSFEFGEQKEVWVGWGGYDIVVAPGDFDGDGDPDLIARNSTTKALWLYKGDGNGSFEFGEQKEIWAGWGGYDMIIAPGDFDGDGDPDLIARNSTTKAIWLYKGDGKGSFEFGEQKELWAGWGGYDMIIAPGDFDGDGDPDLIARNATTKAIWLYKGDGNGSFEFGEQKELWAGWGGYDMIITPGDFDGDGDPDLIARNSTTKAIWLYKGDGNGSFEFGAQKEIWAGWGGFDLIV
ncbi:FG-GAP repeat domain-containing protein [Actinoplanes lobatus]|uniref:VCBS repeat-containing protein n=1 Tax=Actinoplanes lobatus TaxID=113568 RepID=A0A7W7HG54_9ACTN|nr:VCBS repeat-containing protein [Actinoplanes lobatus]MBB4749879.1 hypothetical protein [Actinoplanes lobatus]